MAHRKHAKSKRHHAPEIPVSETITTETKPEAPMEPAPVVAPEVPPVAAVVAEPVGAEVVPAPAKPTKQRHPFRTFMASMFVAVGAVGIISLTTLSWASWTLLNTNNYVKTVTPLATDPAIQTAIQQYAFEQITAAVDLNKIVKDVLPSQLSFLSAPIASQVEVYVNEAIGKVVRSDQFAKVWVSAQTKAHAQILNTIAKADKREQIALNLTDVYGNIRESLLKSNLGPIVEPYLPSNEGAVELIKTSSSTLKTANMIIKDVPIIQGALVVLIIITFGGAIWVSANRRRTIMWVGFGTSIGMALTVVVVRVTRTLAMNQIIDPVYNAAAQSAWQILLRGLFALSAVVIVVGIIVGLVAILAGPNPRRWFAEFLQFIVGLIRKLALRYPKETKWIHENETAIIVGIIVFCLLMAMFIPLTAALIIAGIGLLLIAAERVLVTTKPQPAVLEA